MSQVFDVVVTAMDKMIIISGAPKSWPPYATRTFTFLAILCIVFATFLGTRDEVNKDGNVKDSVSKRKKFKTFQISYLTVFLITMLADWLQGTNMYTLYSGYNMPVGILFLTGFTSSAVFGTFCGLYVDKYGRKMGCILFCLLEIVINTFEHFPNLYLLLIGRVLGGISTSAFESWMVTEHRSRGFPEQWLAETHGLASTGNGIVAVIAGVLAQLSADAWGDIGPFRLAIFLTVLCLGFVLSWSENYGKQDTAESSAFSSAFSEILSKRPVFLLGAIQAFYEGSMFTFVFVWVPTVLKFAPSTHMDISEGTILSGSVPPLGLVFASFMLCITLGGLSFGPLTDLFGLENTGVLLTATSSLCMLVPVFSESFVAILASFLLLEACIGCWFACSATLRSKYIDDKLQSSIMTIFRVPLNVLVVIGTRMEQKAELTTVFTTCAIWFGFSFVLQSLLAWESSSSKQKVKGS